MDSKKIFSSRPLHHKPIIIIRDKQETCLRYDRTNKPPAIPYAEDGRWPEKLERPSMIGTTVVNVPCAVPVPFPCGEEEHLLFFDAHS